MCKLAAYSYLSCSTEESLTWKRAKHRPSVSGKRMKEFNLMISAHACSVCSIIAALEFGKYSAIVGLLCQVSSCAHVASTGNPHHVGTHSSIYEHDLCVRR